MNTRKIAFLMDGKKIEVYANICSGTFSKAMGKMFNFSKKPLLFSFKDERSVDIHMAFVFMPLLVIWLDENMKITKERVMKPFVSFEGGNAKYVLEIPLKNEIIKEFCY